MGNTRKKGQRDSNQKKRNKSGKEKVEEAGDMKSSVIEYQDVLELGQADHWGSKQRADRKVARGNAAVKAGLAMSYSLSSCMSV